VFFTEGKQITRVGVKQNIQSILVSSGGPRNSTLGIQISNIIKKRNKIDDYHYPFGVFLKNLMPFYTLRV
jgi:hypothetical protein